MPWYRAALRSNRRQQPGTPVYTTGLIADNARTALAQARPEHTVQWRARMAAAPIGG